MLVEQGRISERHRFGNAPEGKLGNPIHRQFAGVDDHRIVGRTQRRRFSCRVAVVPGAELVGDLFDGSPRRLSRRLSLTVSSVGLGSAK